MENLKHTLGSGTKSFATLETRLLPTEDVPRHGSVRQEWWIEAGRGQAMDYRIMAIAMLAGEEFAQEHPERSCNLILYGYRTRTETI